MPARRVVTRHLSAKLVRVGLTGLRPCLPTSRPTDISCGHCDVGDAPSASTSAVLACADPGRGPVGLLAAASLHPAVLGNDGYAVAPPSTITAPCPKPQGDGDRCAPGYTWTPTTRHLVAAAGGFPNISNTAHGVGEEGHGRACRRPLCLVLPARSAIAAYWTGSVGAAATATLFVLPLLYTVPRGRAMWSRRCRRLLAAHAVLTYVPALR